MGGQLNESDIQALSSALPKLDYYRLLRLRRDAEETKVHSAYRQMRRLFNPDRFLRDEPDVHAAVERIARRISEAYIVLGDATKRQAYDAGLADGELRYSPDKEKAAREDTQSRMGRTPQGRRLYAQAIEAERAGDVKQAISSMKLALGFEAQNPYFRTKLEDLESRGS